jgi:hypothetical protein
MICSDGCNPRQLASALRWIVPMCPSKALGMENSVNISIDLPVKPWILSIEVPAVPFTTDGFSDWASKPF